MGKKGEEISRKTSDPGGALLGILLGTGVGLALLLVLAFGVAALIWSGVLPAEKTGLILSGLAGLCAFIGGRVAVGKGSGGPMPLGAAAGACLCVLMGAICLGTTGSEGLHGRFLGVLLMLLAGGCLAGLLGRKKKKKKR